MIYGTRGWIFPFDGQNEHIGKFLEDNVFLETIDGLALPLGVLGIQRTIPDGITEVRGQVAVALEFVIGNAMHQRIHVILSREPWFPIHHLAGFQAVSFAVDDEGAYLSSSEGKHGEDELKKFKSLLLLCSSKRRG